LSSLPPITACSLRGARHQKSDCRGRSPLAVYRRAGSGWKRDAYTGLSSLTHYIVISQDAVDVTVFARDTGFAKQRIKSLGKEIELRSLGVSLPVAEIYRDTGLTA
jgi:hypothetical protein